mgnify:CR=1 FL=1
MDVLDITDDYDLLTKEEKDWASYAHFGTFLGFVLPAPAFVFPLIIYFIKKDESEFVRQHAAHSFNFQISMIIVYIVLGIIAFITFGIGVIFVLAMVVVHIVVVIKAGLAAQKGDNYKYFFCINMLR